VEPAPPVVEAPAGTLKAQARSVDKQAPTAVTTFGAGGVITAAGALFVTNGVQKNDRVTVVGSTSNDRTWYVDSVVSETQVVVRPLSGLAALTVEAAAGTVSVRQGSHQIIIEDEATTSFGQILASGVAQIFGSGAIGDFLSSKVIWSIAPVGTHTYTLFLFENGISSGGEHEIFRGLSIYGGGIVIRHTVPAGLTTWNSQKEVVVATGAGGIDTGFLGAMIHITFEDATGSFSAGISVINIGTQGADRFGGRDSSAWIGVGFQTFEAASNAKLQVNVSLSAMICNQFMSLSRHSVARASLFHPSLALPALGNVNQISAAEIESCAIGGVPGIGYRALMRGLDANNLLITDSDAQSVVSVGSTAVEVVIGGLLKSPDVTTPTFLVFLANLVIQDPREDYTLAELFQFTVGSDEGHIRYTYNPRFVETVETTGAASPISGLSVEIFSINLVTLAEVSVFSGTTDADGRIGGGDGVVLERAFQVGLAGTPTQFNHRVLAEGGNFKATNQFMTMRSQQDVDFPMAPQQTDFEGEFNA
jgi:hypothetical protein